MALTARSARRAAAAALILSVAILQIAGCGRGGPAEDGAAPQGEPAAPSLYATERHDRGFAGSGACAECHKENYESWHASFHRTMTQPAAPAAVAAPVPCTTPVLEGLAWKFTREGDALFATPVTPDGAERSEKMQLRLVTGSHHYQIYWMYIKSSGELAQVPLVWHLGEKRWIPRKAMFLQPPVEDTDLEMGRWSQTCMKCHATHAVRRAAPRGDLQVAEFGIACEACHGSGAAHAAEERARRGKPDAPRAANPQVASPKDLDHVRSSQVCGQCHAVHPLATPAEREAWETQGFAFRPGEDLARTRDLLRGVYDQNSGEMRGFLDRHPETLTEMFWSDGQVRVSGREYNALVASPCYTRGKAGCLSCHEMHIKETASRPYGAWRDDQLAAGMDGNAACTQCHETYRAPEKAAAHAHHPAGSTGAECMNCHMPYTTYGLTKAIRSHTVTSPDAAATLATGRPNACNQCHIDRSLGWTADQLQSWWKRPRPKLTDDQERISALLLHALSGDAGQRVLAAWNLAWPPALAASSRGWTALPIGTLLQDPYDAVRHVASRAARLDPRHADFRLDLCATRDAQAKQVAGEFSADWSRDGVKAPADRRAALLLLPDGTLDQAAVQRLLAQQDRRDVRLGE